MQILKNEATNCSNIGSYKNTLNVKPLTWHRVYKLEEAKKMIPNETYEDILNKFGTSMDTVISIIMLQLLDTYPYLNELVDSEELSSAEIDKHDAQIRGAIESTLSDLVIEHIESNPNEDPLVIGYITQSPEYDRLIKYLKVRYNLSKGGELGA